MHTIEQLNQNEIEKQKHKTEPQVTDTLYTHSLNSFT